MNTKPIPSVIMLLAGFVMCVIGITNHMDNIRFFIMLLSVLIVFYIIGSIVKLILDKNIVEMSKEVQEENELPEEESQQQDIQTDHVEVGKSKEQ